MLFLFRHDIDTILSLRISLQVMLTARLEANMFREAPESLRALQQLQWQCRERATEK